MSDGTQDVAVAQRNISAAAAQRLIESAIEKAEDIGVPMAIAVVDTSGQLKAYLRMDGAALLASDVAIDKAYTAVGFGLSTDGWYDFIKDDGPLALGAPAGIDRLVIIGGGYPVEHDDQVIGAIGVSGGHYSQDMEVAEAALEAF